MWAGVVVALIYWFLASVADTYVHGGDFFERLLARDVNELWTRGFVVCILILFGAFVQSAVRRRARAEQALSESEERFKPLFDEAPVGYHEIDTAGHIIRVNRTELEMLGYSEEEMLGRPVWEFIVESETSRKAIMAKIAEETPPGRAFERTFRRKDGSHLPVLIEDRYLRDEDGRIAGLRSTLQDIAARKRTEQALRESEERYRSLIETSPDAITLTDLNTKLIMMNEQAARLHGFASVEEMRASGKTAFDLVAPEDRERAMANTRKALAEGSVRNIEYTLLRKDGSSFPAELSASLVADAEGKPVAFIGITRDISARRQAEEALRESEERYAFAARGANDGLWDWNLKTDEVYYSTRWKRILGCEEDEIGSKPEEWFDRVHPEDLQRMRAEIEAHLKKKTPLFENEHRVRHRDGSYRWVLSRGMAIRDAAGQTARMAGSLTDITERKVGEVQLLYEATHDSLSALYNRRYTLERLTSEVRSAKRYRYPLALCICDLDHFKSVNDVHGHRTGDMVLSRFGRLIAGELRAEDIAGRYGGDEFCLVFPHTSSAAAQVSVERIRNMLAAMIFRPEHGLSPPGGAERGGGDVFSVTASFGIAELSSPEMDDNDLLVLADKTLYQAKDAGRNRIFVSR